MNSPNPCYYPGEFSPPTKYHLDTVNWLLRRPEVSHVHIVLGSDKEESITQEQKAKLWEILLRARFSPQASVIKSKDAGPLSEIHNILSKKKGAPAFLALDEKSARNKEVQKKFEIFPQYEIQLIPSQWNKTSKEMMRYALEGNKEYVKHYLPEEFTDEMVEAYMSVLVPKKQDPESPQEQSPNIDFKNQYMSSFDDGFWKSVFEPIAKENIGEEYIYNKQVGSHKYKGVNQKVIDDVTTYITKALRDSEPPMDSDQYRRGIDAIYKKIVEKNPEIGEIDTDVEGYDDAFRFPKHDIVFGVMSGIPPEAIKDYVEITKGHGWKWAEDNLGIKTDTKNQYVSIIKTGPEWERYKKQNVSESALSEEATVYSWKYVGGSHNKYEFISDGGLRYEVLFTPYKTAPDNYERSYRMVGKKHTDKSGENKPFSINATVMDITNDFLNSKSDLKSVVISPITPSRTKLVMRNLQSALDDKFFADHNEEDGTINIYKKADR